MTKLVKQKNTSITRRSSKKSMQEAIKQEIEKIDAKLDSLGLPPKIVYICGAIPNHETSQNTIRIDQCNDLNWLYRALAYNENMYDSILKNSKEMFGTPNTEIRNSIGILIRDVISDLRLRIKVVTHQVLINSLTQAKAKLTPFLDEESRLFNTIKEVEILYKDLI